MQRNTRSGRSQVETRSVPRVDAFALACPFDLLSRQLMRMARFIEKGPIFGATTAQLACGGHPNRRVQGAGTTGLSCHLIDGATRPSWLRESSSSETFVGGTPKRRIA